jgi:hypothetical protein
MFPVTWLPLFTSSGSNIEAYLLRHKRVNHPPHTPTGSVKPSG